MEEKNQLQSPLGDISSVPKKTETSKPEPLKVDQLLVLDDIVYRVRKITNKDVILRPVPKEMQVAYLANKVKNQINESNKSTDTGG